MEKHDIETIVDYKIISSGRKRYIDGFILKGCCQVNLSGEKVFVKLIGAYGRKDYDKGYLTVCEEIFCPDLNQQYSDYVFNSYVAFFRPKKKKEEVIFRFEKGLERVLNEISSVQEDIDSYFNCSFERRYLECSDYLYLRGVLDLYKKSAGDLLYFFEHKDRTKEEKKAMLDYIYNCDFENQKVIDFLEQNELDLLKEVAFS